MAKYNPRRHMLFWHMENIEGGGNWYQVMVIEAGEIAVQVDDDGMPFRWPVSEAAALKANLSHDGWQVVEDGKHFAALGDGLRGFSLRNFAWYVGQLMPESGGVRTIGSTRKKINGR